MNAIVLNINGKPVRVSPGETLVSAGLLGGIVLPHDCMTGQCETCRVSVVSGDIDAHGTQVGDTVLACQAKAMADASITFEEIPGVAKWTGQVESLTPMQGSVWEVIIALRSRIPYLPGQYVYAAFGLLPERAYSPTIGIDAYADELKLVFHVRVYPGGEVSQHLGGKIKVGTRVAIRGPYGHAFLRRGEGRLVFVSNGTGFAPIWAMALAARLSQPNREMVIVTGGRSVARIYMEPALHWLRHKGVENIIVTAGDGDGEHVKRGFPSDHIPQLLASDTVYVAGSKMLVDAVVARASVAESKCYSDPFTPAIHKPSLGAKFARLFQRQPATPKISQGAEVQL